MRTILARLALIGVFGITLSGCGGSNGTSLPTGGGPNGSGGGPVQSTLGNGPPPPGTEPALAVDGGATPGIAGTLPYKAVAPTVATDVVVPGTVVYPTPDPSASPDAPTPPPIITPGSNTITYTSAGLTTETVTYSGKVPSLVYTFGIPGNGGYFNYNEIDIIGAAWTGTPVPASIAVELVGGSPSYDVRLVCAAPAALSATAEKFRCLFPTNGIDTAPSPVPPYYIANSYGGPSGTYVTTYTASTKAYGRPSSPAAIPALLFPSYSGTFTAYAPTAYIVLSFGAGTPSTTGMLTFVALEAIQ